MATYASRLLFTGIRRAKTTSKGLLPTSSFLMRTKQHAHMQSAPLRPRRALLYVPGNDHKKITKASKIDADVVCLDFEDGVALNRKEEAREVAIGTLQELDFGRSEVAIRINPAQSELAVGDIEAILASPKLPDAIVLPKVETHDDLVWFFDHVEPTLMKLHQDTSSIPVAVLVQIETPLGMLNLEDICKTDLEVGSEAVSLQVEGLILGGDDLVAAMGAVRTKPAAELLYARQRLVMHAKAFGLQAIDIVNIHYQDSQFLKDECDEGVIMGFTGKQIIHPNQVAPTQEAFAPTDDRIQFALELEVAFELHQELGKGAFTFQDKMIDMPTMLQCQNVLELARSIGKIPPKDIPDEQPTEPKI